MNRVSKCLAHNFVAVGVVGVGLLLSAASQDKQAFDLMPATEAPATVVQRADCWTTPAEHPADLAGQEPGSVVIGGGETSNPRIVHEVVEQAYFGVEHGFTVYGFCR